MDPFEPPVAFHFEVSFAGPGPAVDDAAFQEVSGLESSLETEAVVEGGENRFVHQLPKPAKRGNLKLKRALEPADSGLMDWCKSTIEGGFYEAIKPMDITVSLLDEENAPLAVWAVGNAYPVKWTIGAFDAMKNEIAIETIELAYTTLERKQ